MPKTRPQCGLILENGEGKVILQHRDNIPDIKYPDCLGTFGGQIEIGETSEQAIVREIWEELRYKLTDFDYFGNYPFDGYDIHMFRKIDRTVKLEELVVKEGQRAVLVAQSDVLENRYNFAFNCREILVDYFKRFK